MKKMVQVFSLFLLIFGGISTLKAADTMGINFIVDQRLADLHGEDVVRRQIDEWIYYSGLSYAQSQLSIVPKITSITFRNITNSGTLKDAPTLKDHMAKSNNGFENIFTLADRFGADYTFAIVGDLSIFDASSNVTRTLCGSAQFINKSIQAISDSHSSLAVMDYDCDFDTLPHEIGHLMGMVHGDKTAECTDDVRNKNGAITTYAKGYSNVSCSQFRGGVTDFQRNFSSIMVGNYLNYLGASMTNVVDNSFIVPFLIFSNPRVVSVQCGFDRKCGDAINADASKAIQERVSYYTSHETPDADAIHYDSAGLASCIGSRHAGLEVTELNNLNCSNLNMRSIEGINQLTALAVMDLSNNQLTNVGELASLNPTKVQSINLTGNDHILCHQLDELEAKFPGSTNRPAACFNVGALIAVLSLL